jgi:hypothetical protein
MEISKQERLDRAVRACNVALAALGHCPDELIQYKNWCLFASWYESNELTDLKDGVRNYWEKQIAEFEKRAADSE